MDNSKSNVLVHDIDHSGLDNNLGAIKCIFCKYKQDIVDLTEYETKRLGEFQEELRVFDDAKEVQNLMALIDFIKEVQDAEQC